MYWLGVFVKWEGVHLMYTRLDGMLCAFPDVVIVTKIKLTSVPKLNYGGHWNSYCLRLKESDFTIVWKKDFFNF